ncbi:MAG: ABC transporter ATP-binding protein, partial [Caulobacteraceae bacterium]|nr:ABC transporter ATP-binding protein [Caulobacteraceae bacterium]
MAEPHPLLAVEDLRIEARGAVCVHGLSFELAAGEILGVVGESGSGKTLAARAVLGLLPPGVRQAGGRIRFDGQDLGTLDARRMRALRGAAIGMVFQEPMVSLNPAMRIGEQLAEALRFHGRLSRAETRRRAVEMLERVRIADPDRCLEAFPHEFSGGMRQRIMLASAMLLRPKLLIADEPTTALDTLSQKEVLDLMVELTCDFGTAVMLITHNLGLVSRYAERALVLEKGRLVEQGPVSQVLGAPSQAYTRRLVGALPTRGPARAQGSEGEALLQVRGLRVAYPSRDGRRPAAPAVDGVDLDVRQGETLALVGGSGSGKTSLGRAILGLVPRQSGAVSFRGIDPASARGEAYRAFRRGVQLVFQDPYASLDPRMRIGDIVGEPLRHARDLAPADRVRRVEQVLEEVGLDGFARRLPHALSGGQRQRVAIARAIVGRPAFVVADEPVSALDMTIQAQVLRLFQGLQQAYGFACLFISHDLAAVEQVADRVAVMEAGRIVEIGSR